MRGPGSIPTVGQPTKLQGAGSNPLQGACPIPVQSTCTGDTVGHSSVVRVTTLAWEGCSLKSGLKATLEEMPKVT